MRLVDCIGNTPMIELPSLFPTDGDSRILAKLEGNNPAGSVKDRPAYTMIREAQRRGELSDGIRLIEPTSGNTGIALAMIAATLGLEIELVMPEDATRERVLAMRAYGATVTLTPAEAGMEGAIDEARRKVDAGGYRMLDQFSNPDNPLAHFEGTGPEIWRDTDGRVTHFVSSMGTTGTIMGTSRYLKQQNPEVEIVGVQPAAEANIPGIRRWPQAYLPRIFEPERVDRIIDVGQEEAEAMARRLAREAGVSTGASGGGAVAAAVRVAQATDGAEIVVILPDRGDRYLSSNLFDPQGGAPT